jgi:hypothetical protein
MSIPRVSDTSPASAPEARPRALERRSSAAAVLDLQRRIGNRATAQVLRQPSKQDSSWGGVFDIAKRFEALRALSAGIDRARASKDWNAVAQQLARVDADTMPSLLSPFTDDDLLKLVNFLLSHPSRDFEPVRGQVFFALFQRDAGKPAVHEEVTVVGLGTGHGPWRVPGGVATANTGVRYRKAHPDALDRDPDAVSLGYALSYVGDSSASTRWLQFVWFEVISKRPGGPEDGEPLALGLEAADRPLETTTDRGDRHAIVDAATSLSAFYEEKGASNRTANSTTIFDAPTSQSSRFVDAQFSGSNPATQVTSKAHMVQYLVRDMQVLLRVNIDITWVFTSKAVPTPTFAKPRAQVVPHLNPEHRRALVASHQQFSFIP